MKLVIEQQMGQDQHGSAAVGSGSAEATPSGSDPNRPDPSGADWPNREQPWQRVSPSYAWADLAGNLLMTLVVAAAFVLVTVLPDRRPPVFFQVALAVVVAVLLVNAVLAFRRVRAIGYVLREDDLLFRRGIMFERVIAVPYGRLQLVDLTRGPILRALGLATLKFVTASAATGVNLPGLRLAEAEALRDRLVQLAETRRSGL